MSNGEIQCNEGANCQDENLRQSSDELYSSGGGRKTDFAQEDTEPPQADENKRDK